MPIVSPGAYAKRLVSSVQDYSLLTGRALGAIFSAPYYFADTFIQLDSIGVGSVPIVILAGFFTGAVLTLQSTTTLKQFGAANLTGRLVSLSMIKELGPVLTGLMVSGRNASGMASELGSMKVSEQIDAMRALGTDPVRKLVTPRIIATVTMLFFLTIISDTFGICGGALVAVTLLRQSGATFFHTAINALNFGDIVEGLTKPLFSGFIIATVGCYYGLATSGGTRGVGKATTQAVVTSSVLLIIVDTLVTKLMIGIFGR